MQNFENLKSIFNNINDWLKFAEAKNFGLLTLNGALIFGITQTEASDDFKWILEIGYYCLIPFSILSFMWCLISLFPILTKIQKKQGFQKLINQFSNWIDKETPFENIHFYGYLRGIEVNEFEQKYLSKTGTQDSFTTFEKELVVQILYNSRITWLKYQCFKIGAFFFLIGIVLSILLLPIINACR